MKVFARSKEQTMQRMNENDFKPNELMCELIVNLKAGQSKQLEIDTPRITRQRVHARLTAGAMLLKSKLQLLNANHSIDALFRQRHIVYITRPPRVDFAAQLNWIYSIINFLYACKAIQYV